MILVKFVQFFVDSSQSKCYTAGLDEESKLWLEMSAKNETQRQKTE